MPSTRNQLYSNVWNTFDIYRLLEHKAVCLPSVDRGYPIKHADAFHVFCFVVDVYQLALIQVIYLTILFGVASQELM